jgi:hypothetical protein
VPVMFWLFIKMYVCNGSSNYKDSLDSKRYTEIQGECLMSKIDKTESIQTEIDGKPVIYNLRFESHQRNKMLMATVSYGGKSKAVSQTILAKDPTAFQSFRDMSVIIFKELYEESNKDFNF